MFFVVESIVLILINIKLWLFICFLMMKNFRLLRVLCHFLLVNGIFFLTYKLRLLTAILPDILTPIPLINGEELRFFAFFSSILFVVIGGLKGFYPLNTRVINHYQKLGKIWIYWFVGIAFFSYFGQGYVFVFGLSRFIILIGGLFVLLAVLFFDQIWRAIEYRLQKKLGKKILIILSDTLQDEDALQTIRDNFSLPTDYIACDEVGSVDFKTYEMCVAVGMFEKTLLQKVFDQTRMNETRFFHISEGYFLEDVVYTPELIQNIIALEYKHSQLDGRSLILKRIFDVVWAIFALILLSPVLLLIAIAIKLESKGPIIYKSKRVGKWGQLFTFLKFRSMYTHMCVGYGGSEADKLYQDLINSSANTRKGILPKIHQDPRVTKVWRFLRKTSLDELPQLICVLMGTMSLVGPRPHLQNEVEKYESWERRLLSIKPGITGYAQVFWRDNLTFDQEAKLDLYYIQNWSLGMDMYVIFGTLGVIFKGR